MTNKITRIIALLSIFVIIGFVLAASAIIASRKSSSDKTISPEEAGRRVLDLANKYFLQNKNAAISGEPAEESGLYKVNLNVDKNTLPFYLTKDGKSIIFPNGLMEVEKIKEQAKKEQAKDQMLKADRPSVELFVMSFCPYGVKALKDALPLKSLFKDKIDFKIKYIVSVKGESINEVESLHGSEEVKEDLRQAAIIQFYPDKFSLYLEKINEKSCLISCGALKLEDYWKETARTLKMDVKKIESFAYGREGMELLKQNEADAKIYAVEASPTLIINGVKSDAIYSGTKATQEAICSAFSVLPNECQEKEAI